ncbi:hypothetical protein VCHENC02_4557A, partial [Vibrio harveyi]|jgi:hypothetical protein
MIILL